MSKKVCYLWTCWSSTYLNIIAGSDVEPSPEEILERLLEFGHDSVRPCEKPDQVDEGETPGQAHQQIGHDVLTGYVAVVGNWLKEAEIVTMEMCET